MECYLGLLIDAAGVVRDVHRIDSQHDYDAVELMRELLLRIDGFETGEVWRGRDRVAKVHRPRDGAGTAQGV